MSNNVESQIAKFNAAYLYLESLKKSGKTLFSAKTATGDVVSFSTLDLEHAMSIFTGNDGRTPNMRTLENTAIVEKNQRYVWAILAAANNFINSK